jgi:MFS family permease
VASRVTFWLAALILSITMLGTTLPTPLYVIYQAQWHFSAAIVTVTFAVYAVAVLATLLLAGRSSDQAGRKPVLATALAASALSTVVFILAPNVGVLIVGRILSGLSAGLMTGTATAALTELVPATASRRASLVATAANMGGLGLGPLIAGLFAQYAPHPTTLVFEVYLAVLVVAGICLLLVPETVIPRRRPAFADLKREGKVRAIGLSNHDVYQLEEAEGIANVDAIEPQFSLIHRDAADDVLLWAREHEAGVIVYSAPPRDAAKYKGWTRQPASPPVMP